MKDNDDRICSQFLEQIKESRKIEQAQFKAGVVVPEDVPGFFSQVRDKIRERRDNTEEFVDGIDDRVSVVVFIIT